MRGDINVIEYLNKGVRSELTAMNQYWLHYRLLDNWGYKTLAKKWHEESIEEMQHADKLIACIIFLDGMPKMQIATADHSSQQLRQFGDVHRAARANRYLIQIKSSGCTGADNFWLSVEKTHATEWAADRSLGEGLRSAV
jgi:bacterioferritin